jgi:cell division protein FtsN
VQEAAPAVKALKPAAARARKRECCYFVIASFNKEKDARNLLRRHHGLAPQVVTATVDGDRKYRVVVGPFSDRGRETARRRIESAGIARPWIMAASG